MLCKSGLHAWSYLGRARDVVGRSEWLSYPLQAVTPLREMKGMLPNRLRPLVFERRAGAVGRCTEHSEPLAANHRLFAQRLFGAELKTHSWKQDSGHDSGCTGRNLDLRTHVPCKWCRRFVLMLCARIGRAILTNMGVHSSRSGIR